MMIRHIVFLGLATIGCGELFHQQAQAAADTITPQSKSDSNIKLSFGPSPWGFIAVEYQKRNHGYGFGLPGTLYYRFYRHPNENTVFYGAYVGYTKTIYDDENVYNGMTFEKDADTWAGTGAGYLWQWPSGWNLAASLSIYYKHENYISPGLADRSDTSVTLFPGIDVGYNF